MQREYPKYCINDYLNQNSCETSTSLQIVYDVFTEDISHDPREKKIKNKKHNLAFLPFKKSNSFDNSDVLYPSEQNEKPNNITP